MATSLDSQTYSASIQHHSHKPRWVYPNKVESDKFRKVNGSFKNSAYCLNKWIRY